MAPLTREQIKQLQDDLGQFLAAHGLTGGYLVAESWNGLTDMAQHCLVVESAAPRSKPSLFIGGMSRQSFAIVKSVSKMEVNIFGN